MCNLNLRCQNRLLSGDILRLGMAVVCIIYVQNDYWAEEAAIRVFHEETVEMTVETWKDGIMVFTPRAGLIFYPCGKVEYTACAPLTWKLTQEGDGIPTMSGEEQFI